MTVLVEESDALLLDLDGTVYLGGQVIPHVVPTLIEAARRGARPMFVTNNASRPPAEVAAALNEMGVAANEVDVLTSPEAAATMLAQTHPAGSPVLIVGAKALSDAVANVGLVPVRLVTDNPVAVVQGHSPDTGWRDLAEACIAIRSGVDWVASNTDTTLPTDRGLLPGNGAMVHALMAATDRTPRVAGKPNRPLLDEAVRRAAATSPLVVGDRLDTDIEAAVLADMPSLFVLTGVSTPADLLAAPPARRPTYVAFDLRGLVDSTRVAKIPASDVGADRSAAASAWTVEASDSVLLLHAVDAAATKRDDGVDLAALALLAALAWSTGTTDVRGSDATAAAVLERFGFPTAA
ncbi:HAD superfamily hydrolase (TIGR01450 family) [Nakamurella sp. UYEF19]|uniref:HAD-IIA family hydrolase n=1 Tax=Nakamurella sp. UYEF19 TaxID=1756392 RepID=UPI0033981D24